MYSFYQDRYRIVYMVIFHLLIHHTCTKLCGEQGLWAGLTAKITTEPMVCSLLFINSLEWKITIQKFRVSLFICFQISSKGKKKKIIPASHSSHIQAYLKGLIQTRKLEALTSLSFTDLAFVRKAISGAALVVHMALLYLLELRLE